MVLLCKGVNLTMASDDPLERPSQLLRSAHLRAEELWSVALSDVGLTPRQKVLLEMAGKHPGSTLSFLADRIRLERQTAAEMVHRLVGRGLLECRESKYDKRAYSIWLTEQSIELLASVAHLDAEVEAAVLDPLPPEYQPLFLKCLKILDEAATRADSDAGAAGPLSAAPVLTETTRN